MMLDNVETLVFKGNDIHLEYTNPTMEEAMTACELSGVDQDRFKRCLEECADDSYSIVVDVDQFRQNQDKPMDIYWIAPYI